ncbi:hypothetical protein ScPMuIL_005328 [Solemya velum]
MSKRKGLSIEEKRTRMMEFFFEKKDIFLLKELERQCQKEKGITSMSVKEILTSLVDDGLVDTDKIGTSVYFWAFPSKASQNRKRKLDELTNRLTDLENKKRALTETVPKARMGKEDSEERLGVLAALQAKKEEEARFLAEIERYRKCDPEVLKAARHEAEVFKEAANRWTDNIFSIKSWIKQKFAFDDQTIDKQFDIPAEFDYVD